jgi:hypothetical protein
VSRAKWAQSPIEDESSANSVDEALYLLARRYGRTILLLDRFGADPLAEAIAAVDGPAPASLALDDRLFVEDPQSAPLLVELQLSVPSHQSLLRRTIHLALDQASRKSGPHPICAWIFSKASLSRLQSSLRIRLDARYPDQSVYFRYFDPRVMPHLARIMPTANDACSPHNSSFCDLLGPVESWCQIDSSGKLLCHQNPAPGKSNHLIRLHFDETMVAALQRIELVNLTLQHLAVHQYACGSPPDAMVDGHLLQALEFGVKEGDDQVSYAWRATKYSSAFTHWDGLRDLIQEASSIGVPLDPFLAERMPEFI